LVIAHLSSRVLVLPTFFGSPVDTSMLTRFAGPRPKHAKPRDARAAPVEAGLACPLGRLFKEDPPWTGDPRALHSYHGAGVSIQ
jgi:hypothetical protein